MPRKSIIYLAVLALAACGSSANTISMDDYDGVWPYTIPEGRLKCIRNASNGRPMVLLEGSDSTSYALNGPADSAADRFGFRPMDEIYRTDENGIRLNPDNEFIQQGLELCN